MRKRHRPELHWLLRARMDNLFPCSVDTLPGTPSAIRELGAYEALWMRERTSIASLARLFRRRPGSRPSDWVTEAQGRRSASLALDLARRARIGDFGLLIRGAPGYPARLRDAVHPIEVLYYQGRPDLLGRRGIALVGTRHPSRTGAQRARRLARHLAAGGFMVLSGLAAGIDTIAHRAAIEAAGATAAVLGTPLTAVYPPGNAPLQRRLARDFLIVTQVPIVRYARQDAAANRRFFRERNATLAALAETVVVIEAGDRSGALICARHALDCGRRVLVPERCCQGGFAWPGRLLRRGAMRVRSMEEIDAILAA